MTTAPNHLVAAVMDVLDYDDPQQPWIVHGDRETLAERIVDALPLIGPDADPTPARVDVRPFTSDDAAAIAGILLLAPVIGAVVVVAGWVRRQHRRECPS